MRENRDKIIMLSTSALYLERNLLSQADELYSQSVDIDFNAIDKKDRTTYLRSLWVWVKRINSERSREVVRGLDIDKRSMSELHYYILILKKRYLYPLLLITWIFV